MSSNGFQNTDIGPVSEDIAPDAQTIPLGVGNFEEQVSHDPLAGAESKRRIDTGSLLILGVVVVSIGGLAAMRGFRVEQIPVGHRPRLHGVSKYGVWNRVFRGLRDLRAVAWMLDRQMTYRVTELGDGGDTGSGS